MPLFMHYIALCTPCIALLLVSHTCIIAIDPVKQEPEEPTEQAQVEEFTNLAWTKTSSGASHHILDFYFELISLCSE
jgi:hypothetical protein